jgi:hypothetical protein
MGNKKKSKHPKNSQPLQLGFKDSQDPLIAMGHTAAVTARAD